MFSIFSQVVEYLYPRECRQFGLNRVNLVFSLFMVRVSYCVLFFFFVGVSFSVGIFIKNYLRVISPKNCYQSDGRRSMVIRAVVGDPWWQSSRLIHVWLKKAWSKHMEYMHKKRETKVKSYWIGQIQG